MKSMSYINTFFIDRGNIRNSIGNHIKLKIFTEVADLIFRIENPYNQKKRKRALNT